MEDELVLIATPNYFDDAKVDVPLDELMMLPLILREEGSGTRSVMENHLIHSGKNPSDLHISLELGSTKSVKSAVETGLGVSIISKTSIKKELQLQLLKAYPLKDVSLHLRKESSDK